MAKWAHREIGNMIVMQIRGNEKVNLCICSAQPVTIEEAESTYALAIKEFDSSDLTIPSDGVLTIPLAESMEVLASDDATHVAIVVHGIGSNDYLSVVTTCDTEALTEGTLVSAPSWQIIVHQPT
jgi:hypothetical protein